MALDRGEAGVMEAHVRGHGVDVRAGFPVDELERTGAGIRLRSGEDSLEVDFVVGAIGVVPNTGFLVGCEVPLGEDGGIRPWGWRGAGGRGSRATRGGPLSHS